MPRSNSCGRSHDIRHDVEELGRVAASMAAHGFEQLREKVDALRKEVQDLSGSVTDSARGQAQEFVDQGREKASAVERAVEKCVREKPLHSVLVVALVAFVFGALWRRR